MAQSEQGHTKKDWSCVVLRREVESQLSKFLAESLSHMAHRCHIFWVEHASPQGTSLEEYTSPVLPTPSGLALSSSCLAEKSAGCPQPGPMVQSFLASSCGDLMVSGIVEIAWGESELCDSGTEVIFILAGLTGIVLCRRFSGPIFSTLSDLALLSSYP